MLKRHVGRPLPNADCGAGTNRFQPQDMQGLLDLVMQQLEIPYLPASADRSQRGYYLMPSQGLSAAAPPAHRALSRHIALTLPSPCATQTLPSLAISAPPTLSSTASASASWALSTPVCPGARVPHTHPRQLILPIPIPPSSSFPSTEVLSNYQLRNPCSALELNLEPFL